MYRSKFICIVSMLLYGCIPPIYMRNTICGVDVESIVSKGVALQHHQFWSAKTADVIECARICVKRKLCQSFNFDTNRRQCELNNEFYSNGKEVRSSEDLVYSNIAQWPSQIEPNCFARPCDVDEICIPGNLLGDTGCSYTCLKMAFSIPTLTVLPPATTSQASTTAPVTTSNPASPVSTSIPSSSATYAPSTTVDSVRPLNIQASTTVSVTATTPTHTTDLQSDGIPTSPEPIACGDPPFVSHGAFLQVSGDDGEFRLVCDEGFFPRDDAYITCLPTGEWTSAAAVCRTKTMNGRTFYTIFPKVGTDEGNDEEEVIRQIFITSFESTSVSFRSSILSANRNVQIDGFNVQNFSTEFKPASSDAIEGKVIKITSYEPISVHTMVTKKSTLERACDSFFVLPVNKLAREYILVTTEETPQFFVIGTEDDTTVEIDLVRQNAPFNISIGENEVFNFFRGDNKDTFDQDLTGSIITSNKDVAVISGGFFASIPSPVSMSHRDASIAQMIGVSDWLKTCILAPLKPQDEYVFKIVASENDTEIDIISNAKTNTFSLNRLEKFIIIQRDRNPIFLQAQKPILAVMFPVSSMEDGSGEGDTSMVQCQYTERYLNFYTFFVPPQFNSYIRIIIQNQYTADLRLNSMELQQVDALNITIPGGTVYAVIYTNVKENTKYTLETTSGVRFGADLHGYGAETQYSHNIGGFYG